MRTPYGDEVIAGCVDRVHALIAMRTEEVDHLRRRTLRIGWGMVTFGVLALVVIIGLVWLILGLAAASIG